MTEQWRKKEQTERTQSTMRLKMNRGCMEGDKRGNEVPREDRLIQILDASNILTWDCFLANHCSMT